MSTVVQKLDAPRVPLPVTSLRESLEAAGVTIPDQVRVRRMMEATRLGLWETASERRIQWAWFRRAHRAPWTKFEWRRYTTARCPAHPSMTLSSQWGGIIPAEITRRVATIQKSVPQAKITVYATYIDPWVEVSCEGDEPLIVGGWIKGKVII